MNFRPAGLPVAILAGGLATRMRPLTERVPKALLEVAGKPFIDWQLQQLAGQGVRDVVLCVGYLGEMLEAHVGNGARFGLRVHYSPDGPTLLGTGGALRQALHAHPAALGSAFFVLYGDSYLPIDFAPVQERFAQSKAPALMTVLANGDRWDTSNVLWQDGKLARYSKRDRSADMRHIDYGLGVIASDVLLKQADGPFDLAHVYERLSEQGQLAGQEVHERFYEIGSPQGLADTHEYLSNLSNPSNLPTPAKTP